MNEQKGHVPEYKKTYIRVMAAEKTVSELVKELGISDSFIMSYCKKLGIKCQPSQFHKKNRKPGTVIKGHTNQRRYPKPEPAKTIVRPPAVYSNANYLEKYL